MNLKLPISISDLCVSKASMFYFSVFDREKSNVYTPSIYLLE